jgi:hypothetical protein
MKNRIILRTISSVSFAGSVLKGLSAMGEKGVTLKPSDKSNIRIWCPLEEIESIILPNGEVIKEDFEKWV